MHKKFRFFSLFSGIGAPEKALDNLGISYELVGFSEIDKYATKSYCAVHSVDESMNLGDITKIDESTVPNDIDLITYGFPCQDISLGGKQKGLYNEDGTQTRSGLFFEALRIIEETQPRIAIAENVKNLTSKRHKKQFEIVLNSLENAGYNNYWKVLSSKDYGIPQKRERVFIVSIRKDVDDGKFTFPEPLPLELRLKDILEDEVAASHYLGEKGLKLVEKHQMTRIDRTTKAADLTLIQLAHGFNSGCEMDADLFPTLTQGSAMHWHTLLCEKMNGDLRVRKLTPKECWRLMGFDDEDFEKAEAVNSNTQLYKQAGNSIVVPVLEALFIKLKPYLK